MTRASPVNELWRKNNMKLTVDTAGAKGILAKYAAGGGGLAGAVSKPATARYEGPDSPIEDDKTNMIPISNFKSNKLS